MRFALLKIVLLILLDSRLKNLLYFCHTDIKFVVTVAIEWYIMIVKYDDQTVGWLVHLQNVIIDLHSDDGFKQFNWLFNYFQPTRMLQTSIA